MELLGTWFDLVNKVGVASVAIQETWMDLLPALQVDTRWKRTSSHLQADVPCCDAPCFASSTIVVFVAWARTVRVPAHLTLCSHHPI